MKIAIIGATGYIGSHLIKSLLNETNYDVLALSRTAEDIDINNPRLTKFNISIFDKMLSEKLKDIDVVFYLIHMMSQKQKDYAEAETEAANLLNEAAKGSKIKRIIFLGGLGRDTDHLSKHLKSRHNTGNILRRGSINVIELRASMIIGRGSISYDIIVNLVSKLPFLTLPKWSETYTQPIGLSDTLAYLVASIELKTDKNLTIEIGGPDKLSYENLMRVYAKWKGLKRLFIRVPIIPISVSAWWLNLFTPEKHAQVGRIMVESLANEMIVTDDSAKEYFPEIKPKSLNDVFV
jgi:uncharacterized protein YbjT (DUF2867 family)